MGLTKPELRLYKFSKKWKLCAPLLKIGKFGMVLLDDLGRSSGR